MTGKVVNAADRFRNSDRALSDTAADYKKQERRNLRSQLEADKLRATLSSPTRLQITDRKVIARNLGRAIERNRERKPTQIATELFVNLFGQEGGAIKAKKRKRYIRFSGEDEGTHAAGNEYAASGREFVRLINSLAFILDPTLDPELAKNQLLIFACDGTSFSGPSRPRITQSHSAIDAFDRVTSSLIDKIIVETDIVQYFMEVPKYNIRRHPHRHTDLSSETINNLHLKMLPCERFEHLGQNHPDADGYSRLDLRGFDIPTEEPSVLYPRLRIARVYVPRRVLRLPISVATSEIKRIQSRELSLAKKEQGLALWQVRKLDEYELWRSAIRDAGHDPDENFWEFFQNESSKKPANGAEYRRIWETMNVDLYLIASNQPDALRLGINFTGGTAGWWTTATKRLSNPKDDDDPLSIRPTTSLVEEDGMGPAVPWFPEGDKCYVSKPFFCVDGEGNDYSFEPDFNPYIDQHCEAGLRPIDDPDVWAFMTQRAALWDLDGAPDHRAARWGSEDQFGPDELELALIRPLFETPKRWTPAPDGSLASLILSSFSYGEGEERLDIKFLSEINHMIGCYQQMQQLLQDDFETELSRRLKPSDKTP